MAFDVSVAITWILFLALFPMAFFWLRRAWRILARRDFSEVALKRGEPPPDAQRWAPYTMLINGIAGTVVVVVIGLVLFSGISYDTWTAIAGSTIWIKFMLDFALSRHAHGFGAKKKA
jgi:small-conductance mechanosensitive channel